MKVIFLRTAGVYGYGYFSEDVADIEDSKANMLISKGVVAKFDEKLTLLPAGFPRRSDFIQNGYWAMELVERAAGSGTIKEIDSENVYNIQNLLNSWKKKNFEKTL